MTPDSAHTTRRTFATSLVRQIKVREGSGGDPYRANELPGSSHSQPATNVSQKVGEAEKDHFQRVEEQSKEKQMRSPWMRDGSDKPPVATLRSAGAMTKGKLLTTPSRMLKLILPLTTKDTNKYRKDVEPLALLVHPQQPLSYLERLIQSELPMLSSNGKDRSPNVIFRAQDSTEEDVGSGKSAVKAAEEEDSAEEDYDLDTPEETVVDGKLERTGKLRSQSEAAQQKDDSLPVHGHAEKQPHESPDPEHPNFVRWSPSTEIGDFIRDAARGKEFAVDVEGANGAIYVGVPSFQDRTYYLRMRLQKTSKRIGRMADLKKECDALAHKGAQRMAQLGFSGLIGWWAAVYYATFLTDLGWDVMEPVTYLVGLSGLIGGYMWFLYHNREVSYRSAMNFTVSRRQSQLYDQKGFNLTVWEGLVEEGNKLRREVKMVADEYDVEWDESKDEGDEKVAEALRKHRQKKHGDKEKKEKDEDEGDDD
ncbi:hypothetical protein B0A50_07692 [Salinomyces thailandicus]|uniref:Calcium uniporter protein n=1 Tax=Salinomyces thailandicus TaxID=706561 RepID=A0A4U0TLY5_9PEZI|nr:hypothetical protein B0A50_07692 [Salinomyces thailandica]